MKTLLLFILLGITISVSAQSFYNSGFEDWVAYPGYYDPAGYETYNYWSGTLLDYPVTTKRSTPHSGNYSVECLVDTNIACSSCSPDTINGYAVSFYKIPFTNRPANLTGYYQLIGGTGTHFKGIVMITLSRWNTALMERESVAATGFISTTLTGASWTNFDVPLFYFTAWVPDTISVEIHVDGDPGTRFLVDDLMFYGSVGLDGPQIPAEFTVYPSPASDELNIAPQTEGPFRVRILDAVGKEWIKGEFDTEGSLLTASLPAGIYMVEYTSLTSLQTQYRKVEILH